MSNILRGKYGAFISMRGGIFTPATRKRLLKISPGRPGWSEDTSDFRSKTRQKVRNALKDLELFLDVADKKDVDQFLNSKIAGSIIDTYFQLDLGEQAELGIEKINIALYFVYAGFEYLSRPQQVTIAGYEKQMIDDATSLSHRLADSLAVEFHKRQEGVKK